MNIKKKAWPALFQAVLEGRKNFDLRLADFEVSVGDVLVLKEWDPEAKEYTGRTLEKEVSYVLKTKEQKFWTEEDIEQYGYQIISLK